MTTAKGCASLTALEEEEEEAFEEHLGCDAGVEEVNGERLVDFGWMSEEVETRDRCTSLRCPSTCSYSVSETSLRIVVVGQEVVCSWRRSPPYWNPWEEVEDLVVTLAPHFLDLTLPSRKQARRSREPSS